MVELSAFRAIRYESSDLGPRIAPPYDVIDSTEQDSLYARHPHNIIRIDLNKPQPGDAELARYDRASAFLKQWLAESVLIQEASPAMYLLEQTFVGPDGVERKRTGFFARARLARYEEGVIMPHERTLRGPKVDRLHLFRATRANLSPIFCAYRDAEGEVRQLLQATATGQPLYEATMGGVQDRLHRISDKGTLERLSALFGPRHLYIADGHHRYETALAYRDERRSEIGGRIDPSAGYEHVLVFSAAVEDPGMVIFPTHRLIHSLPAIDLAAFTRGLARFFDFAPAPQDPAAAQSALREAGRDRVAFLMASPRAQQILTVRPDAPWSEVNALPKAASLRDLDVTVLHAVILETLLGLSKEAQASQTNVRYSKDFQGALSTLTTDRSVQLAFLLNPTKIQEVINVAESGEVMPQKSTFFYPKIPTGMVLCPLD